MLMKHPSDPTASNPPGFALVSSRVSESESESDKCSTGNGDDDGNASGDNGYGRYDALKGPNRDQIDSAISRGNFIAAREERRALQVSISIG